LRNEALGRFKVRSLVSTTRHLHAGNTDSVRHDRRIALRG